MLFVESHRPLAFVIGHLLWLLQPLGMMALPGLPVGEWAERLCRPEPGQARPLPNPSPDPRPDQEGSTTP
jgi:hypothetical protein